MHFRMTTTGFICTVALIALSCYDGYAVQIGGVDASISAWAYTVLHWSPTFVFTLGWLACHFMQGQMIPVVPPAQKETNAS